MKDNADALVRLVCAVSKKLGFTKTQVALLGGLLSHTTCMLSESSFTVQVFENREKMGKAAGSCAERVILQALKDAGEGAIRMIFAAAPSQNEVLAYLAASKKIDWSRVDAFHMDEYIGLSSDAPQGFGNFLDAHLFKQTKVPFRSVHYLRPEGNVEASVEAYAKVLSEKPVDVCLLGIGENGHIAFNDPAFADFHGDRYVRLGVLGSGQLLFLRPL